MRKTLGLALLFCLACGGGDDEPTIATLESFQACGGELEGTWTFSNADVDLGPLNDCPTGTQTVSGLSITGATTFRADMTYSFEFEAEFTTTEVFPVECLPEPAPASCQELGDECSGDIATGCECVGPSFAGGDTEGTWAVTANTVTLTHDENEDLEYCVGSDFLQLRGSERDVQFLYTLTK